MIVKIVYLTKLKTEQKVVCSSLHQFSQLKKNYITTVIKNTSYVAIDDTLSCFVGVQIENFLERKIFKGSNFS